MKLKIVRVSRGVKSLLFKLTPLRTYRGISLKFFTDIFPHLTFNGVQKEKISVTMTLSIKPFKIEMRAREN